MDEELRKVYQKELESLEHFRMSYSALYPDAGVGRDDPDVRRLIEAMAFFSSRTKTAAERVAMQSTSRLFRQHFSYLLDPRPASGMLAAAITGAHTDFERLPPRTEVVCTLPPEGQDEEPRELQMLTTAPLDVAPLQVDKIHTIPRRGQGPLLEIDIVALTELKQLPSELSLHVDHFGELLSSMEIFDRLTQHARSATLVIDGVERGPARLKFGPPEIRNNDLDPLSHPLGDFRFFMQLPQQDLFMRFLLPAIQELWSRFTIRVELDAGWPAELEVAQNSLRYGVTPVVNLVRESADPIRFDATRDRYPVRHPDAGQHSRLCSVMGVYRESSDGLAPMKPSILGFENETYEVDAIGTGADRRAWISADIEGAYDDPVLLSVDAFWHQPIVADWGLSGYEVALSSRFLEGVTWGLAADLKPPQEPGLGDNPSALLKLVAMKSQEFLSAADLSFLLEALGAKNSPVFEALPDAISSLEFVRKPSGRTMTGFVYTAEMKMGAVTDPTLLALRLIAPRLLQLLRNWGSHEVADLNIELPDRGVTLREG